MSADPDKPVLPHSDYRSSHLEEGEDYHAKFEEQVYRALIWSLEREALEALIAARPDAGQTRLLDFACGTGRVLGALARHAGTATGVDISASMLAVAKRVAPGTELICADLTRESPLKDRQFDVITAFRFFPNAEPALREDAMGVLARLLAPGGSIIINNHRRAGSSKHRLRKLRARLGIAKAKDLHTMSDAEVSGLAARHGLVVNSVRTLGFLPVLKERRPLLPRGILLRLERRAARLQWLEELGSHRIYELRHASPAAAR